MCQTLAPGLALERDRPEIARQPTLAQHATLINAEGVTVRATADPKEHVFQFAEVEDEDPAD